MSEEIISIDKWFEKKITISRGSGLIIIVILLLSVFTVNTVMQQEKMRTNEAKGLEISTMIRNVKHELFKADSLRIAKKEGALFRLKDFQMEISFTVRQVTKAGVNVGYKFVTVEGGSETGNEKIQKLILRWDAIKNEPKPITVTPSDAIGVIKVVPNSTTKMP